MGWWTDQVVPRVTDRALGTTRVHDLRARACFGLEGRVVEIGFGSGLNARHYPAAVSSVAAVEPSDVAWRIAAREVRRTTVPVSRAGLDGQHLDLPDDGFDAALSTFALCTIPDAAAALAEVARVLRPGGELHFLEHGLAPGAMMARCQHLLTPLERRAFGGCHLDRPIADLVEASGLRLADVETSYLSAPTPWTYVYLGRATRG